MIIHKAATRLTWLSFMLGFCMLCPATVFGQQPFYYYPAYGAHRGRISYHQGPFGGSRQKIRWGGGLTDNGAAVLLGAIDAAGPILTSVLGGRSLEEDTNARNLRDSQHQRSLEHEDRQKSDADELLDRTRRLRDSFTSFGPAGPATPPLTGADNFQDWPNTAPAGGGGAPAGAGGPSATGSDTFGDWPNAGQPQPPSGGAPSRDDFRDWPAPR